jgi:hypothetical protein
MIDQGHLRNQLTKAGALARQIDDGSRDALHRTFHGQPGEIPEDVDDTLRRLSEQAERLQQRLTQLRRDMNGRGQGSTTP